MGFLERFIGTRGGEKQPTQVGAGNSWDGLKDVSFRGDETDLRIKAGLELANQEQQKKIAQQHKAIRALSTGNIRVLTQPDVEISAEEQAEFYNNLNSGRIYEAHERWLLENLQTPIHKDGPAEVYRRDISGDKHQKRILAYFGNEGFDNYNHVSSNSVREFLEKYPLPMDFEPEAEEFLEKVKGGNSEEKYQEYCLDMDNFKQNIYGKRQEYWERIKELHQEADAAKLAKSGVGRMRAQMHGNAERLQMPEQSDAEKLPTYTEAESLQILQKAEVSGDIWEQYGNKYSLTTEVLKNAGLEPKYKVKVEDVEIGLSSVFQVGKREATIGYVQTKEGVKVRGYYRSLSQGMWRYLPDYVADESGEISWYGKSYTEDALNLPFEVQETLAGVMREQADQGGPKKIANTVPAFLLAGTAKKYHSQREYAEALRDGKMRGDFYAEVSATPAISYGRLSAQKNPPEKMDIIGAKAPNFTEKLAGWRASTRHNGAVQAETYASEDKSIKWLFFQDRRGEAWVAGAETNGKVTSTGLRASWVELGDIATPTYEHETQDSGYGDRTNRRGNYVDMWKNYVSKMPIIRKYLASKNPQ